MHNHTDLLNWLCDTFDLKSYLEIGIRKPELNFYKIKCPYKYGCDPNVEQREVHPLTSDEFFSKCELKFDLIFIDGLHHADQVKRDFENSLRCLTDHGFIVIHDTLPTDEKYTHVPRDSRIWFGDVWKFAINLPTYSGIDAITVDIDCGCTVVWKDTQAPRKYEKWVDMSFDDFYQRRKGLLFVSPDTDSFKRIVKRLHDRLHTYSEQ